MPKSAPKPLKLDNNERQQLQQLVNRHSTPQQMALRAEIILLADEGHNHREIARMLDISRDMARLWRERWLTLRQKDVSVAERLQDAERPGAPATFSLEQILQLFALGVVKKQVLQVLQFFEMERWCSSTQHGKHEWIIELLPVLHQRRLCCKNFLRTERSCS